MKIRLHILFALQLIGCFVLIGSETSYRDCSIRVEGKNLIVENSLLKRVYEINNGNLITELVQNKTSDFVWHPVSKRPDMSLPGCDDPAKLLSIKSYIVEETSAWDAYVEAEIIFAFQDFTIKRLIRLYPECPVVGNDLFFKGNSINANWYDQDFIHDKLSDIRFVASGQSSQPLPVLESVSFGGKHWLYRTVSVVEMTDHLNSLVTENEYQAYKERLYKGNLLFALNSENDEGFFILKESPSSLAQLKYPSGDFLASYGSVKVIGLGIDETDIKPDVWTSGYSTVFGLFSNDELNALKALKSYQSKIRKNISGRDDMIMMNTWGDRGAGERINEQYIINELELCNQLGITHFQIDDGWQTGKSPATTEGGSFDDIWARDDYWIPDNNNFPNGLAPVVKRGKELGIEVCIWFNPSYTNNYESWKRDAEALIDLNKKYGIRTFKIDGLRIHDKLSEERVDNMLSMVSEALDHDVVFNLDVTADKRFGYFYKNRYGNIFLENRYTDFVNYYPYWTLQNLWMLSKYVPSRNLQIEFLNKWRNSEKYGDDPFAPANYDFEYLFAITMMSQPLAWMEAQNLPKEAFEIAPVIKRYREYQSDILNGVILPVGNKPSGSSWTGFQSQYDGRGYFLIFREYTENEREKIKTWLQPGCEIELTLILGEGEDFKTVANENGEISFKIIDKNSYSLYQYRIIK